MKSDDLLNYFRLQVRDDKKPYLASDFECYLWMDEAQKEFCRLTAGLADAVTPEIVNLTARAGTKFTALDPRILRIVEAYWTPSGSRPQNLSIINQENLATRAVIDYGIITAYGSTNTPGQISEMVLGVSENTVQWNPPPDMDYPVTLTVYRLPLNDITDDGQDFEIQSQHVINLSDWMMFRYYSKQDAETYDKTKAPEAEARFRAYCDRAKQEQERAKYKPRVIAYGGL